MPRLSSTFTNRATFGAGCYWGTEKFLKVDFNKRFPGVVANGQVGFMGPPDATKNPSYLDVCTGFTKQVEVYDFIFNGDESTYEKLLQFFFSFHDPTTLNRQGGDTGTQYASLVYVHDEVQRAIAERVKAELQWFLDSSASISTTDVHGSTKRSMYEGVVVTTAILPATTFYPAEEDHQEYLAKNPGGYCNHFMRYNSWPAAPLPPHQVGQAGSGDGSTDSGSSRL